MEVVPGTAWRGHLPEETAPAVARMFLGGERTEVARRRHEAVTEKGCERVWVKRRRRSPRGERMVVLRG